MGIGGTAWLTREVGPGSFGRGFACVRVILIDFDNEGWLWLLFPELVGLHFRILDERCHDAPW
jgi:hypothetical protein